MRRGPGPSARCFGGRPASRACRRRSMARGKRWGFAAEWKRRASASGILGHEGIVSPPTGQVWTVSHRRGRFGMGKNQISIQVVIERSGDLDTASEVSTPSRGGASLGALTHSQSNQGIKVRRGRLRSGASSDRRRAKAESWTGMLYCFGGRDGCAAWTGRNAIGWDDGQAHLRDRRRRQLARQGADLRLDRHAAGAPRPAGPAAEARPVHQRRSRAR